MKRRVVGVLGLCVAVAGLAVWRLTRQGLSDEAQILNLIIDVRQGVETKDARRVLRHVSDDYDDGQYRKRDIVGLVINSFRDPEPFHVYVERPRLRIHGDRAEADVRAQFWTGAPGAESRRQFLDLHVELVRSRGGWQVVRARGWEAAMEEET